MSLIWPEILALLPADRLKGKKAISIPWLNATVGCKAVMVNCLAGGFQALSDNEIGRSCRLIPANLDVSVIGFPKNSKVTIPCHFEAVRSWSSTGG